MAQRQRTVEATCGKCGAEFYEKRGFDLHTQHMHRSTPLERNVELETVTDSGAVKATITPTKRG